MDRAMNTDSREKQLDLMAREARTCKVHKKKLVHRDIKPSNIMVSFEEEGAVTAKIIDLGVAKVDDEGGYPWQSHHADEVPAP
jgi:serine/threonine protein kinase